jgi:hypothetical protein
VTNNDRTQRTQPGAKPVEKPGYVEFKAALLEFMDVLTPATLVRYLNASRALGGLDPPTRRPAESVDSPDRSALPSRDGARSRRSRALEV